MSKTITAIAIAVALAAAGTAFARMGGYGNGYNQSYCAGQPAVYSGQMGQGFKRGGDYAQVQLKQYTEEEAKQVITEYAAEKLKGYTLGEMESFQTPRGFTVWLMPAEDSNGNKLALVLTPRGFVRVTSYPVEPGTGRFNNQQ